MTEKFVLSLKSYLSYNKAILGGAHTHRLEMTMIKNELWIMICAIVVNLVVDVGGKTFPSSINSDNRGKMSS